MQKSKACICSGAIDPNCPYTTPEEAEAPRQPRLKLAEQKLTDLGFVWEDGKGYVFDGKS